MITLNETELVNIVDKAIKDRSETTDVEFKDARGGIPSDLWKSVSSFSHKPKGGMVVFGIKEDRINHTIDVVGGLDLASLQEKIVSLLNDGMKNVGNYELKIFHYNGTPLLALILEETPNERKTCYNYHIKG
ncbi:ATP-binding protein [Candidatus Roizmanbacteria bacterium]|nr:ATP-binding protein [Candidatus Roizmanbacteria bacterium]